MNQLSILVIILCLLFPCFGNAQKLDSLQETRDSLVAVSNGLSKELDFINSTINELNSEISRVKAESIVGEGIFARTVNITGIDVRETSSALSKIITTIPGGQEVVIIGYEPICFKIRYGNVTGFVPYHKIVATDEVKQYREQLYPADDQGSNDSTPNIYRSSSQGSSSSSTNSSSSTTTSYGTTNPSGTVRRYQRGPRGGCYYINKNGNKTYVDRSNCGG